MYPTYTAEEIACIELIFGLTGGELSDKPLRWCDSEGERGWTRYWYEGPPDYFLPRPRGDYMTMVRDCMFGEPPRIIYAKGREWRRVQVFRNSGEAECWSRGEVLSPDEAQCPLCDARPGEEHSYCYIGDGWCEVVYWARV